MRLKPTKSLRIGDITSFVIKVCSLILSPVLTRIFYLSNFQHHGNKRPLFLFSREATAPLLLTVGLFIAIEIAVNFLKL
jgi:hypothetical protein